MRRRSPNRPRSGVHVIDSGGMPPGFVPPSTSLLPPPMKSPPPPPPPAPRTGLTADEQIRAKALELAVQVLCADVAAGADLVDPLVVAERYANYIRGDAR